MTSPMPEPSPTPTPSVKPFDVATAKGGGYSQPTGPNGARVPSRVSVPSRTSIDVFPRTEGEPSKGVFFLRPKPLAPQVPGGMTAEQAQAYGESAMYRFYAPSEVEGAYDTQVDPTTQMLFETVARAGGGKSGSALFGRYVKESQRLSESGIRKSPTDILYEVAMKKGILKDDGTFTPITGETTGGRGAGYSGPVRAVSMESEDALRRTADALGAELLGRAVSDDEFQKILKRVRSAEQAQPTVTSRAPGATVTETGISAEGRKDIMRDMLAQNPESQEFLKATKFMGMFNEWLDRRAG